eukprot:14667971-Alexandrium_andersonii.AAC.1
MTRPAPLDPEGPVAESVLLARRFSRHQGEKPDASPKLRAVDDMTRSGVNGACLQAEHLHNCSIDQL